MRQKNATDFQLVAFFYLWKFQTFSKHSANYLFFQ